MERAHHCWVIESAMICRNHRLPRRPYTITVPPVNRLPYTAQGNTQSLCPSQWARISGFLPFIGLMRRRRPFHSRFRVLPVTGVNPTSGTSIRECVRSCESPVGAEVHLDRSHLQRCRRSRTAASLLCSVDPLIERLFSELTIQLLTYLVTLCYEYRCFEAKAP